MSGILLPSVQSLLVEMAFSGQPLATGTAFVCSTKRGPVLTTNGHNLTGRNPQTKQPLSKTGAIPDTIRILHNRKGRLGEWVLKSEQLLTGTTSLWREHPTFGDKADVVALPLNDLDDVELFPHDLAAGPAISILPSDTISVVGFPFALQVGGSLPSGRRDLLPLSQWLTSTACPSS
jgi:hypothetical protein